MREVILEAGRVRECSLSACWRASFVTSWKGL